MEQYHVTGAISPNSRPRAPCSEPSLPRRSSMEDADSSLTRKRPRLDGDERGTRSMSADRILTSTTSDTREDTQKPKPNVNAESKQEQSRDPLSPLPSTPSKVTINLRSQNFSPQKPPNFTKENMMLREDQESDVSDKNTMAAPEKKDSVIDGTQSPPVEVINVDPVEQPDAVTELRLDDDSHCDDHPNLESVEAFLSRLVFQDHTPSEVVRFLVEQFQKEEKTDPEFIHMIACWLHDQEELFSNRQEEWDDLYTKQFVLWDNIGTLILKMFARRYNRALHYLLVEADGHRHRWEGRRGSESVRDVIPNLIVAYARIVARLIHVDTLYLRRRDPTDTSEMQLVSAKALRILLLMLAKPKNSAMWSILEENGHIDVKQLYRICSSGFLGSPGIPGNGTRCLVELSRELLCRATTVPALVRLLLHDLQAVVVIISNCEIHSQGLAGEGEHKIFLVNLMDEMYPFFIGIDEQVHGAAGGILSPLADEHLEQLITMPSTIIMYLITISEAIKDNRILDKLFDRIVGDSVARNGDDDQELIPRVWEIRTLKRNISKGRMGMRVAAINILQGRLVQTYNYYTQNTTEGVRSGVMQALAQVLLDEKVVDYIISADSHPQLISRSDNVLGFLIVTNRWSEIEMDAVWTATVASLDPRVYTALVELIIRSMVNLFPLHMLLYLCGKLEDIGETQYTVEMSNLLSRIFDSLLDEKKLYDWASHDLRAAPFRVALTMLRRTFAPSCNDRDLRAILGTVTDQLRRLVSDTRLCGRSEFTSERRAIYEDCVQDIANKSPNAAADMHALRCMLSADEPSELHYVIKQLSLTKSVVEELCTFVQSAKSRDASQGSLVDGIHTRFALLSYLIVQDPDSFPSGLYDAFWDHALGAQAINNEMRDLVWQHLIDIARPSRSPHPFLHQCIAQNINKLAPDYYTQHLLLFLKEFSACCMRSKPTAKQEDGEALEFPAFDSMWRVVLTAYPNTLEKITAELLAHMCCSAETLGRVPLKNVEAAHVNIVNRCVLQLSESFTRLLNGTQDVDAVTNEARELARVQFKRVFLILSALLEHVRRNPRLAPPTTGKPRLLKDTFKGTQLSIRCHVHRPESIGSNGITVSSHFVDAGEQDTCKQFYHKLEEFTGSSSFMVIWHGQKLNLLDDASQTLSQLGMERRANIIVKLGSPVQILPCQTLGSSALEREVLNHFDELYSFMDTDEDIAVCSFGLLKRFNPPEKIRSFVASPSVAYLEMFPPNRVWKAAYHISCLKTVLDDHVSSNSIDSQFILHSVQMLTAALTEDNLLNGQSLPNLDLLGPIFDTLLAFFEPHLISETSEQYFAEPSRLVSRLLSFLQMTLSLPSGSNLACDCYDLILRTARHSKGVWKAYTEAPGLVELHYQLLSGDNPSTRRHVERAILDACQLGDTKNDYVTEVVNLYWRVLCPLVLRSAADRTKYVELYHVLAKVFEAACELDPDESALMQNFDSWSGALIAHDHEEFVGRFDDDLVVVGLTELLSYCVHYLKLLGKPLKRFVLGKRIFIKFLFPYPSLEGTGPATSCDIIPVMEENARSKLYNLVHMLCENTDERQIILEMCSKLYHSELQSFPSFVDYTRILRESSGFVGVQNLSNTCYMNSLITQLFMNIDFRKFMLEAHLADAEGQQRLLAATQKLFATMQNSYARSANAKDLAQAIHTFESEEIDVSVQMDVEEFFNLLFDQWEEQLLLPKDKQRFRSFYGGKLIQQVKSRECEHISERDEGFFTIQLEVKGKTNLAESFKAYVEGDVMEGENKYKCESCGGRFVDAVKRSCLKEIPDNLIVHLKRFDFDLQTGLRSKVNQYFAFPDRIDMSPYTLEGLSGEGGQVPEDNFELVGVLVHKGIADSGHYFSYIRVRPYTVQDSPKWVKYDDADLTPFDPVEIGDCCYGGYAHTKDPRYAEQHQNLDLKGHNAYMLFYQRTSSIQAERSGVIVSQLNQAKAPVPEPYNSSIAQNNHELLRNYGLYLPQHTHFLHSLVKDQYGPHGCSPDCVGHKNLPTLLSHLSLVANHSKDLSSYEKLYELLSHVTSQCALCSLVALIYLGRELCTLSDLLVKSPHSKIRASMRQFVLGCIKTVRGCDPASEQSDNEDDVASSGYITTLETIVECFRSLLDDADHFPRYWDDLYALLVDIAELGYQEAFILTNAGILAHCLERLHYYAEERQDSNILKFFKKKPSYNKMIELVYELLTHVNFSAGTVQRSARTVKSIDYASKLYSMTMLEHNRLLDVDTTNGSAITLYNIIKLWQPRPTEDSLIPRKVIELLLKAERYHAPGGLYHAIRVGLKEEAIVDLCPWMDAAVAYCSNSYDRETINYAKDLIGVVFKNIKQVSEDQTDHQNGQGHRDFIYKICTTVNPHLEETRYFASTVLQRIQNWALNMLMFAEQDDRSATLDLLKLLIFNQPIPSSPDQLEDIDEARAKAVRLLIYPCKLTLDQAFQRSESRRRWEPMIEVMHRCRLWLQRITTSQDPLLQELKNSADYDMIQSIITAETLYDQQWRTYDEEASGKAALDVFTEPGFDADMMEDWESGIASESDAMDDFA